MACASPPPPPLPKLYTINSSPAGAAVKLDGAALGNTPLNFRKDGVATLTIELSGYKTITTGIGPNSPQILNFTLEKDAPTTFTRTLEPTWAGIEVRADLGAENAWNSVVDLLARRFDLEVLSKDNGYIRTNWLYTWTGVMSEDYRVRVTAKFSPDFNKLEVKSEAQFRDVGGWVLGTDEALLQTLKTDIMGSIGRSTR